MGRTDSFRPFAGWLLLVSLTLLMAVVVAASPAWAADTDGDGVDAGDCQPNNPDVHPGAVDKPDLDFQDTNCDGIDGTESGAVFVATSGNDAATGTKGNPLQTIQAGVTKAAAEGKDVYVAGGTYPATVAAADGVGIYGGYTPSSGVRSTAETTIVRGVREAVLADSDQGVVLQLLRLESTADGSRSAYGLRAINGSTVALVGITSRPGVGVTGGNGGNGGTGATGSAGGTGALGPSCFNSGTASGANGGAGGGMAQPGGAGGGGGTSFAGPFGRQGASGMGTGGGVGGSGGTQNANVGGPGSNGNPGLPASGAGAPGASPSFSGSAAGASWTGHNGGTGATGPNGAGGGGGGGGATGFNGAASNDAHGGGGGGGGGGGFGGGGGAGGTFGGGSFGAYAHDSAIVVDRSDLVSGNGGNGGNGGAGGSGGGGGGGGTGGNGGTCATPTPATSGGKGGNGGAGGAGGQGGAGGGGTGGPSYGVFAAGTGSYAQRGSTLGAGSGGTGGLQGGGSTARAGNGAAAGAGGTESSSSDFDGDGVADPNDACPDVAGGSSDTNADGCAGPRPLPAPPGGGTTTGGAGTPAPTPTPTPAVQAKLAAAFKVAGARTTLMKLALTKVPKGGKASVRCKGKGCPFRSKAARVSAGKANVLALFKTKRTLQAKAVLEIRVTKTGWKGQVMRFTMRKGKPPLKSNWCLMPGSSTPRKTC